MKINERKKVDSLQFILIPCRDFKHVLWVNQNKPVQTFTD